MPPSALRFPALRRFLPWATVATCLAIVTIHGVLARTGEPSAPLDDAYIHFQYARSFARLEPFRYTAGAEPAAGATSVTWPLLLSPFIAAGVDGANIVWVAWIAGWVALALLAYDTHRLAQGFGLGPLAIAAGGLVLAFGGFAWFATSGMEVVPFAWVLMRTARRAAEWVEDSPSPERPPFVWAVVGPLTRPEGLLCSVLVAGALTWRPWKGRRRWALLALAGAAVPALLYALSTGQPYSTTARAKWLPLSPYYEGAELLDAIGYNVRLLFGTLLNGDVWTALFLPTGSRFLALGALGALVVVGIQRRKMARAVGLLIVALGMLIPTTYETFLVNRVRYIWPFAAAWFVGLTLIASLVGDLLERLRPRLRAVELLVAGGFTVLVAMKLPASLDDLSASANAVRLQQVSLGRWARDALPRGSRIGLNDAGALAFFSGHATFDIVGLTTPGEARYWAAGPGSRFEHYERLERAELPTHFIVYPEWFAIAPLLGPELTYRTVRATILGGKTMVAREARYDALGSAELPRSSNNETKRRDALDVSDLESEALHRYALVDATPMDNQVYQQGRFVDGGRARRTVDRFEMRLAPKGRLVARFGADRPTSLQVRIDGQLAGEVALAASPWQERTIEIPAWVEAESHTVDIRSAGGSEFSSMHYWSYE